MSARKGLLTEKYPECLVKYEPIYDSKGVAIGIVCGESDYLGWIEMKVDIQRAIKKVGTDRINICNYLNGEL